MKGVLVRGHLKRIAGEVQFACGMAIGLDIAISCKKTVPCNVRGSVVLGLVISQNAPWPRKILFGKMRFFQNPPCPKGSALSQQGRVSENLHTVPEHSPALTNPLWLSVWVIQKPPHCPRMLPCPKRSSWLSVRFFGKPPHCPRMLPGPKRTSFAQSAQCGGFQKTSTLSQNAPLT